MTKTTRALFSALLVLVMVFTAACTGKDADQSGKEPTSPHHHYRKRNPVHRTHRR